jgi:hypothetical protein
VVLGTDATGHADEAGSDGVADPDTYRRESISRKLTGVIEYSATYRAMTATWVE